MEGIPVFLIFAPNHRLWVLIVLGVYLDVFCVFNAHFACHDFPIKWRQLCPDMTKAVDLDVI